MSPERDDLYGLLGAPTDATPDELRRAYLREARAHHPDRRPAAGDRMRDLNAAWSVLGDPVRRAEYDRRRLGGGDTAGAFVRRPDDTFVPYDDGDDPDDGRSEVDEVGDPRTATGRVVLLPVGLAAASLLVGLAWMILDDDRLLPVAVVLGVVAAVSLFLVPLVAMTRAARFERR